MKMKAMLLTLALFMTAMAVVPTVSAHDCDSDWAAQYCGDCREGNHDHNDTSRYNSDGDTSCSSEEEEEDEEDEITQCDIYWLIRDIVTADIHFSGC
jgi:hypothetical protein